MATQGDEAVKADETLYEICKALAKRIDILDGAMKVANDHIVRQEIRIRDLEIWRSS